MKDKNTNLGQGAVFFAYLFSSLILAFPAQRSNFSLLASVLQAILIVVTSIVFSRAVYQSLDLDVNVTRVFYVLLTVYLLPCSSLTLQNVSTKFSSLIPIYQSGISIFAFCLCFTVFAAICAYRSYTVIGRLMSLLLPLMLLFYLPTFFSLLNGPRLSFEFDVSYETEMLGISVGDYAVTFADTFVIMLLCAGQKAFEKRVQARNVYLAVSVAFSLFLVADRVKYILLFGRALGEKTADPVFASFALFSPSDIQELYTALVVIAAYFRLAINLCAIHTVCTKLTVKYHTALFCALCAAVYLLYVFAYAVPMVSNILTLIGFYSLLLLIGFIFVIFSASFPTGKKKKGKDTAGYSKRRQI